MKISVILGHPYRRSFNAAIAQSVVSALKGSGHTVMFHDLYAEGFDPVIPGNELQSGISEDSLVLQHQREIRQADGIIIIHPNWWGQPPAILKGWTDRVLRENIAYAFPQGDNGGGLPIGLLKAGAALVFNTSNTPQQRENEVFGDPLNRLWRDCIFGFCGVQIFDRVAFRVIADSTQARRIEWLNEAVCKVTEYFPQQK